MTQEDKELLLKNLCARLPYGVIVDTPKGKGHVCDINLTIFGTEIGVNINPTVRDNFSINDVKPYLFPLSSMTEEQKRELRQMDAFVNTFGQICFSTYDDYGHELMPTFEDAIRIEKWFNKNHFDYRGLIPMGLANDATGLNIY